MEAAQFASGKSGREIAREAEEAEHDRAERFRGHFEIISIILIWVLAIGFILIGLAWLFHILGPADRRWLEEDRVDDLRGLLTGGLIVGVLTDHLRKRLNP